MEGLEEELKEISKESRFSDEVFEDDLEIKEDLENLPI